MHMGYATFLRRMVGENDGFELYCFVYQLCLANLQLSLIQHCLYYLLIQ